MAGVESRRPRKAVNYADFADSAFDDDFADFRTSNKPARNKDKEDVDWQDQEDKRERKHSKDRHKDHKSHRDKDRHRDDKDRHRKDRDKHRRDRDRHRSRDSKERDERKMREHKGREHRSESRDKLSQDSGKEEGSSDSTCDSSGNQTVKESPAINTPGTTSPIVSPSRRNPKPRLTLEEKIFQRELEAVLELSKEDLKKTSVTPEYNEHVVTKEAKTLNEKKETQSSTPQEHSTGGDCSIPAQSMEPTVEASVPEKLSEPECMNEEFVQTPGPTPTPPPALPNCKITMEPLPSTSTGKTAKRIRKTVVFKEDSDSDFDGFGNDTGAESEESDFMPSPKKKKKSKESKKTKNTKQAKTTTQKPSSKFIDHEKTKNLVSSPRSHPALAKENTAPTNNATTPPPSPVASLKIDTSPEFKASPSLHISPSPVKSTSASPKVTISPKLKASPKLHSSPPVKATTQKTKVTKPVKSASTTTSSSSPSRVTLSPSVKTPFRIPLSVSPNSSHSLSSPASSVGTKSLYRGTGLRLGLSRSANLKPLHPNVARSISN